jgi:hypothetical protein
VAIRDEWDCGWQVRIDDVMEPLAADLAEAAQCLDDQMFRRYPHSKYAARKSEFSQAGSQPRPACCEVLNALYKNKDRVSLRLV